MLFDSDTDWERHLYFLIRTIVKQRRYQRPKIEQNSYEIINDLLQLEALIWNTCYLIPFR